MEDSFREEAIRNYQVKSEKHVEDFRNGLKPVGEYFKEIAKDMEILFFGEGSHTDGVVNKLEVEILDGLESTEGWLPNFVCVEMSQKAYDDPSSKVRLSYKDIFDWAAIRKIEVVPIDKDTNNPHNPERDIKMAKEMQNLLKSGDRIVFVAGGQHGNKCGDKVTTEDSGHVWTNSRKSAAQILVESGRNVKSILLKPVNVKEPVAKEIDGSKETLALPGEFAPFYMVLGVGSVFNTGCQHMIEVKHDSFDLVVFGRSRQARSQDRFPVEDRIRIEYPGD
jgi:hypothetical protein